jgi:phosphoribosylglycinamide formyltransferase 1
MRIAALASHGGSILQAVLDACADGEIPGSVVLVISNNSGAEALARARRAGVATAHLSTTTHPNADDLDAAMVDALASSGADWVLLAGYMKKLGPRVLTTYRGRILNTHPALLPRYGGRGFYGRRVHEAVLAAGDRETGASVHMVTEDYDAGPVIAQVRVPVHPDDDVEAIEARVKKAERNLVVNTLRDLAMEFPDTR